MSTRTTIFLIVAVTWAGLHSLALALSLYWHFWWFDMPMHFIGGVVVALAWLTLAEVRLTSLLPAPHFVSTLLAVLVVAVGWEVFEVWAGIPIEHDYVFDTTTDLVLGLLGGAVGYYLGERLSAL